MSTIKVNKIENTNTTAGGVAIDSSGHVQVDGVQMPSAGALFARNKIINGSMEVSQRGISSTANGYVSLDRWYVNQSGGSTTFSQETFAAGSEIEGLKNYAKLVVSTSSDYTSIRQRIEDVRTVPAGSITVSFWAKGTAPSGNLSVFFSQSFGSGGSTEVDGTPQTVTLTSTWQRFSLTFTVPSISGKTIGTGSFFQIAVGQHTNTGTTAWELDITGVQLEVGEKATPFEHRSYGDELARCQRYYWQTTTNNAFYGYQYISSHKFMPIFHPVTMRATPTGTVPASLTPTSYQTDAIQWKGYAASSYTATTSLSTNGTVKMDAEL